jgi:hypothetical protein
MVKASEFCRGLHEHTWIDYQGRSKPFYRRARSATGFPLSKAKQNPLGNLAQTDTSLFASFATFCKNEFFRLSA